jgi:uncharacterized damage-inducible protein DinB
MTDTRAVISSIESEYRRYKTLGERALAQMADDQLVYAANEESNAATTIVWHISGNLESRFTDFLTTDGEKPWRKRDEEFDARRVTRAELLEKWERGWRVLTDALAALTDADLSRIVAIRSEQMPVHQALHRSLAHTSYHVGQIVYLAKSLQGESWTTLSIPRRAAGM